jgi:hypothetical protein
MSRPVQIFEAPGPLERELAPWLDDGHVRIPLEYWSLVLEFAETLDAPAAERLGALSGTSFVGEYTPTADERAFLARVLEALPTAPPLVPEVTDEYPEAYPNDEIGRMGEAVLAVFDESLRRGEPFRAWDE